MSQKYFKIEQDGTIYPLLACPHATGMRTMLGGQDLAWMPIGNGLAMVFLGAGSVKSHHGTNEVASAILQQHTHWYDITGPVLVVSVIDMVGKDLILVTP